MYMGSSLLAFAKNFVGTLLFFSKACIAANMACPRQHNDKHPSESMHLLQTIDTVSATASS